MFLRNDLLTYLVPVDKVRRILWLHPNQPVAVLIDVTNPKATPKMVQLQALEDDIKTGAAKLLNSDPYRTISDEAAVSKKYRLIRDKAWQIIETLVSSEPDIYRPDRRGKLVAEAMEQHNVQHAAVYRYLRRYWQRGQTPNALLPDYANSGARGKTRQANSGTKRGRPRTLGDQPGLNVTEDLRRIFRVAVARYYVSQAKFTLRGAYDQMIKDFFCERNTDAETGLVAHHPNSDVSINGFPSFGQFNYWLEQDGDRLEIKRERLRPRIYDKDLRGLLGTSTAETWGPGSRYQIDATIADVYLVSRMDRSKVIGRPVLYIVIDVFSRMITGVYVGLEGPSWVGAMMALANTAADKQAFCKQNGKVIAPEDWPCQHLPAILLGDRGEIEGRAIESLINNFNVTVENAAAYRADWKGIVEQRFRLIPAKFKPYVPGYIDVDYRARGGKDYRLDAVLDLDQFTRIVIECILYYNNHHELKRYDKDRDLAADGVPTVPIDLWDWGIANRSGSLRQYPEEMVRFSLLPVMEATVTLNGIRVHGNFYTCAKALEERWFDRARQSGVWKVKVSYDPRNLDEIYLHDSHAVMQFHICAMTERSRAYKQVSIWEIAQQQEAEKQVSAKRQPRQQIALADLSGNIETIVANAVKLHGGPTTASAASRTKSIRANRAAEKQSNQATETFRFNDNQTKPSLPPSGKTSNVVAFPVPLQNDYSEPDITEILAGIARGENE